MSDSRNAHRYGREKLYFAVELLATGTSSIQDRLDNVAISWLGLAEASEDLLPAGLMPELKAIIEELNGIPAKKGALDSTTQTMSEEEGADLARRVLALYIALGCED